MVAVALAMLYPEPEKGDRGKNAAARKVVETTGFSPARLTQARSVLAFSRPMAEAALKNIDSLDEGWCGWGGQCHPRVAVQTGGAWTPTWWQQRGART